MFFVYVLLSKIDGLFYIGFTEDVARRLNEHNTGKVSSTSSRRPLELIYYEAYIHKRDAEGREKFLKSGSGHRFLRKQLHYFLENVQSRGGADR